MPIIFCQNCVLIIFSLLNFQREKTSNPSSSNARYSANRHKQDLQTTCAKTNFKFEEKRKEYQKTPPAESGYWLPSQENGRSEKIAEKNRNLRRDALGRVDGGNPLSNLGEKTTHAARNHRNHRAKNRHRAIRRGRANRAQGFFLFLFFRILNFWNTRKGLTTEKPQKFSGENN